MFVAAMALTLGCSSRSPKTSTVTSDDLPTRFEDLAFFVANHLYRMDPADAVSLGLHKFDGELPDRTPAALAEQQALLEHDRDALLRFDTKEMTPLQHDERDVLISEIKNRLFELVDQDAYRTNPMSYSGAIDLASYIIRDYAPAFTRAAAVIKLCNGLPAYLAQARINLTLPMPRPWIDTALLQTRGLLEFADQDVRQTFGTITVPLANQAEIDPALDTCKSALGEHVAWLEKQQPQGTQSFRLGTPKFLKMLADTQGIELDLGRLQAIAEADLRRNLAAIDEAAKAIDPTKSTAEVVALMANDRAAPSEVLALATTQTKQLRQFILDNQLVSIPGTEDAIVKESPPFQRWNSAFMDGPGVFETTPLPSYYYISPPDPKWPAAEQAAYVPPRADLLFITIHEVYPGHYLHHLHIKANPSKILQAFRTYSTSEGWAHYTEEMMFEAGIGGQTPQLRIGMLKEALLRNVRFVVTLGLHTGTLTVEDATKLFAEKGFVDAGNARQQAVRGTFDPMYLAYTLGKLMIRNLRADWMKLHPGATLREFHDAFLSHGSAPIPVIRRAMLGPSATGSPL
ncbi:DUF885 domain-containing protein [soil metagenome]